MSGWRITSIWFEMSLKTPAAGADLDTSAPVSTSPAMIFFYFLIMEVVAFCPAFEVRCAEEPAAQSPNLIDKSL